ncbi:MAG: acyltransferase, partial [Lachnospiraceae bacterium]|nr:acyltransferase [Lachnospiraceae bacterium]
MTTEKKVVSGAGTKSDSLQALRGLAFAGIFLGHFYYFGWTPISVSVFFILSGFLLTTRKNATYEKYGIADSFKEAVRRISKLYPLHIIMMLVSIPFVIYRAGGLFLSDLLIKIGCNVLLIQSLIPSADINASLNGVSWFLSNIFVL